MNEYPQVIVISDEVYDFLCFDGIDFKRYASIDDNYKRTVTVWSGGKLFNATGWKVGWAVGPPEILKQASLHTYATVYCSNTPIQVAMARSFEKTIEPGY